MPILNLHQSFMFCFYRLYAMREHKTHNQEALLALLMNQSQYQKYIQVAGSILSKEGTTMAQETHRDTLAVNGGLWRGKLWGVGSSTAIERFCLVVRGPI